MGEVGDASKERRPAGVWEGISMGLTWLVRDGDCRLPSVLIPRLNSFSKLSRTLPLGLRLASWVPYGVSCAVFSDGRRAGLGPIGSSGSLLGFAVGARDLAAVSLPSFIECSEVDVPSEACEWRSDSVVRCNTSEAGASDDTIDAKLPRRA